MARIFRLLGRSAPSSLTAASSPSRAAAAPRPSHDAGIDRGSAHIGVKGVAAFLTLAFGPAWAARVAKDSLGVGTTGLPSAILELVAHFAPAAACIIVRRWVTREGFADAGLKVSRRHWPYYLVAWLLPLPIGAVIIGLAIALGISQTDLSFQRAFQAFSASSPGASAAPPALLDYVPAPLLLMLGALAVTPVMLGEEFGWRGYLQLRLLVHRPLAATVVTGLIWGLWHAPLYVLADNPQRPLVGLPVFLVSAVLLSIIFAWLRLSTGSVWSASLSHAATNVLGGTLLGLLFFGGPHWVLVGYTGVLSWLPLGLVCAWIIGTGRLRPTPRLKP